MSKKPIKNAKPCPWCGCRPTETEIDPPTYDFPYWYMECPNDACPTQPGVAGKTRAVAIRRWNTRQGEKP